MADQLVLSLPRDSLKLVEVEGGREGCFFREENRYQDIRGSCTRDQRKYRRVEEEWKGEVYEVGWVDRELAIPFAGPSIVLLPAKDIAFDRDEKEK